MLAQKKISLLLAALIVASMLIGACAQATPAPTTAPAQPPAATTSEPAAPAATKPPVVEPTAAPVEADTPAPAMDDKYGGVLRHAMQPVTNIDPAFLSSVPDDDAARQWHDFLVYIGEDNEPDVNRSVAESWSASEDGLTWTFTLRQGILFHDGKEMTSKDVKFSFDRLRDPEVGASTVELYSNITDIQAPDDYTVVFTLKDTNPDFLKDLGDYHALIMDADATDFATDWNGTGPFILKAYSPEDRMTFERNPNYWLKDDEGNALPYLDGMEFIFIADSTAQVEALRGGQADWVLYLPAEFAATIDEGPDTTLYRTPSNTAYVLRMRSDRGPAADNQVRKALRLATDREAILQAAFQGLGVAGLDSPIGPVYGDMAISTPLPARDAEAAKAMLAEAGYADLTIDLTCQDRAPVPAICTIWKEQLAEAGVTANIQLVPTDIYYGADNTWLEADFAITDWGSRPYPQPYLDLAYTCTAQWNESHWCDEEFDKLAAAAAKEMDPQKRNEYYQQLQQIFQERGPIILTFFIDNLWGASAKLQGVKPTMGLGTSVDLRYVWFQK
jgi:peptide/nickel transport system substrate-binding protein